MSKVLTDAVVLITSSEQRNECFGTGFVTHRTGDFAYVVTCAHVIRDVGAETICVSGMPGTVVVTGDDLGLDLAVIQVEGFSGKASVDCSNRNSNSVGDNFVAEGFQIFDPRARTHRKRSLRGTLAESFPIIQASYSPIQAWGLRLDEGTVQPGYSGSPVFDPQTGQVIAVISHSLNNEVQGAAILIEELQRIWQPVEKQQLRDALLQLGYRPQTRAFRQLIERKPIGAYLIHGPTEKYGQQWLLNRLLQQYVPTSLTAKKFRIRLDRVGRRGDVNGLWAELAMELKCSRDASPHDIAKRAMRWWQTQDVILAIYDVDCLSENLLNLLIHDFWLPLAQEAEEMRSHQGIPHHLLMFLLDFEAVAVQRNIPFTERIDADSKAYFPFKSPQNKEFSQDELLDWVDDQYHWLPRDMTQQTEQTVNSMYELSDGGIPEWTFMEICKRCGYDWRTESTAWCSI